MYDTSRFTICKASAGAGKTFALLSEYLCLALDCDKDEYLDNRFRRILAITFTNKASNEMKEKVLNYLNEIQDKGDISPMAKEICTKLGIDLPTLQHRAARLQSAILHNYSDLAICTIDSFTQHVVRSFARELGLPTHYDIDLSYDTLLNNAIDTLLARAGVPGQDSLTEMLCTFASHQIENGKSIVLENGIKELAKELFNEDVSQRLSLLKDFTFTDFTNIYKDFYEKDNSLRETCEEAGKWFLDECRRQGLDRNDFYQGAKGVYGLFEKWKSGTIASGGAYAAAFFDEGKHYAAKVTSEKQQAIENMVPGMELRYENISKELCEYNTRKELSSKLFSLAVLNELHNIIENNEQDNKVFHISEFNKQIADIVQEEDAPFIYERIGNHYVNYLIDEFQDTSKLQWNNLIPLIENGLATGHASMVVGDGKQAIYRFRQGDVEQFLKLPKVDNARHGAKLMEPGVATIAIKGDNFRSLGNIVSFNNAFYQWIAQGYKNANPELYQTFIGNADDGKAELTQQSKKQGGYVELCFLDNGTDDKGLVKEALRIIKEQCDKGYSYKDITIIARNNNTLNDTATHLASAGIPIVSSESFFLTNSEVVMTLRAMLLYLTNSNDRGAAAEVLERLRRIGILDKDYSDQLLSSRLETIVGKATGVAVDCDFLRSLPLYDRCEQILRTLGLQCRDTTYTISFLGIVHNYCKQQPGDANAFVEWFDQQKKLSCTTAPDCDAVRMMTIHKAKGLEAPIVIFLIPITRNKNHDIWVQLGDTDKQKYKLPVSMVHEKLDNKEPTIFDPQKETEQQKKDLDRINLLYVATTRPQEKLFVVNETKKNKKETAYSANSKLFHDYCQSADTLFHSFTDTADNPLAGEHFYFGKNEQRQPNNNAQQQPDNTAGKVLKTFDNIVFPNWDSHIAIAEPKTTTTDSRIDFGITLHDILAHIRSAADIDDAVAKHCRHNDIDDETRQQLLQHLHALLDDSRCARFFAPEYTCHNECELIYNGKALRPDRIVRVPGETWIVDFKTGSPSTDHIQQVREYVEAVAAIGLPNVKGFILYTQNHSIEEV